MTWLRCEPEAAPSRIRGEESSREVLPEAPASRESGPGGRKEAHARRGEEQVTRVGPRALPGRPRGPPFRLVPLKGRELGEFVPSTPPAVDQGPLWGESLLIPAPKATELEMCAVEAPGHAGGRQESGRHGAEHGSLGLAREG